MVGGFISSGDSVSYPSLGSRKSFFDLGLSIYIVIRLGRSGRAISMPLEGHGEGRNILFRPGILQYCGTRSNGILG